MRVSCGILIYHLYSGNIDTLSTCSNTCENNGTCASTGTCICTGNWTGTDCKTRKTSLADVFNRIICFSLPAICTMNCTNNTICSSPGVCACPVGWSGSNCFICMSNHLKGIKGCVVFL